MSISSTEDFLVGIALRMGSNSANVTQEGMTVAAETALNGLGWSIPVDHPIRVFWAYQRAVRHCLFILMVESAHKFRYKNIFLQNRFAHYEILIKKMDEDFEKAQDDSPDIFASANLFDLETLASSLSFYIPNYGEYDTLGRWGR